MNTKLIYFDESGDDGNNTCSSNFFILTSTCVDDFDWKNNLNKIVVFKRKIEKEHGFYINEEFHTKQFLYDKDPYRKYKWLVSEKREILNKYLDLIISLDIDVFNIVIDKRNIKEKDFGVLENALVASIEKIENKYSKNNYIIISDQGRTKAMNKIIRKVYSGINIFETDKDNKYMIEDILEKDSKDSYFIQISDFISTFMSLYMNYYICNEKTLPKRISNIVDIDFVKDSIKKLNKVIV